MPVRVMTSRLDMVLITHEHYDHNKLELLTMKPSAILHRSGDMLVNGEYRTVEMDGITVTDRSRLQQEPPHLRGAFRDA